MHRNVEEGLSLYIILNEQGTRPGEKVCTCHSQSGHFGKVLVVYFWREQQLNLVYFIHTFVYFLYIVFPSFCLSGTSPAQHTACTESLSQALPSGTNVHEEQGVDFPNLRTFLLLSIWSVSVCWSWPSEWLTALFTLMWWLVTNKTATLLKVRGLALSSAPHVAPQ